MTTNIKINNFKNLFKKFLATVNLTVNWLKKIAKYNKIKFIINSNDSI